MYLLGILFKSDIKRSCPTEVETAGEFQTALSSLQRVSSTLALPDPSINLNNFSICGSMRPSHQGPYSSKNAKASVYKSPLLSFNTTYVRPGPPIVSKPL